MKFTAATFAALVSVATLAAAQDANEARDANEEVAARDPLMYQYVGTGRNDRRRDAGEHVDARDPHAIMPFSYIQNKLTGERRDVADENLNARTGGYHSPSFNYGAMGARDVDEKLDARTGGYHSPSFNYGAMGARELPHLSARGVDELEAREPGKFRMLGHMLTGASLFAGRDEGEHSDRELKDLAARDPSKWSMLGHALTGASLFAGRDATELSAREIEELAARDPSKWRMLGHMLTGASFFAGRDNGEISPGSSSAAAVDGGAALGSASPPGIGLCVFCRTIADALHLQVMLRSSPLATRVTVALGATL
ncbi:hypothetical protein FA09DRAFT_165854 [Tilletiopsis washingtonensis]|uniref:Uncharacterized protein n=1 Tax=Tilletiopsis washingtonensis TaxID=58919 RepID=A0A316Z3I0_9BASI|nr:hypothetical protein FA09DRAFT_165854 [Tilletiopsis washingtonensis]PWN94735.1 hypothetical protein FA09DRAFT_165854 [Tilletiopsis washingtonensis]